MLRILGSERTLCDGVSRRELLQVGGLAGLGLTSAMCPPPLAATARAEKRAERSFGRANHVESGKRPPCASAAPMATTPKSTGCRSV